MLHQLGVAAAGVAGLSMFWVALLVVARRGKGSKDEEAVCRVCGLAGACAHRGVPDGCDEAVRRDDGGERGER